MHTNRSLLGALFLSLTVGCSATPYYLEGKPEYQSDEDSARAWQKELRTITTPGEAEFKLEAHPGSPPDGWRQVVTFIHAADAQIRDFNILYSSKTTSNIADLFASGTKRYRDLDQQDEYPLLALVGGINAERKDRPHLPFLPEFLIHAGDSIEVSTRGELLRYIGIMNLLEIPWFGAIGNHDVLLFGNFAHTLSPKKSPPSIDFISTRFKFMEAHEDVGFRPPYTDLYGRHQATHQSKFVGPYSKAHGFDLGRERGLSPWYVLRVDSTPPLKVIAIDTTVEDGKIANFAERQIPGVGAGQTVLRGEDFVWLKRQIIEAGDEGAAVLVVGHHPLSRDRVGSLKYSDETYDRPLLDFLETQPNVIAYLGGHTHRSNIVHHEDGRGLVEIIAPSLHVFPQVALRVSILEKEGELALFVTPVQGQVTRGSAPDLEHRLKLACRGAIMEEKRLNRSWPDPGACWPIPNDEMHRHKYYGFFKVGTVPRARPAVTSIALEDGRTEAEFCPGALVELEASLRGTAPWNVTWTDGVEDFPEQYMSSPAQREFKVGATREYTIKSIGDKAEPQGKLPERPVRIRMIPAPPVDVFGPSVVCAKMPTKLTATGADEYVWYTGDRTDSITITPDGDTTISVTGTRSGCATTKDHQLSIFKSNTVQIFASQVCSGSDVTLSATPGNSKYYWRGPGVAGITTETATVKIEGDATFHVDVTDANGCVTTATKRLNVPAPVDIKIEGPDTVCAGGDVQLRTNIPLESYYWSTGQDSGVATSRPTSTTSYNLAGFDHNGCPVRASKSVQVLPRPEAIVMGGGSMCEGATQRIAAALRGTGLLRIQWSDDIEQVVQASPDSWTTIERNASSEGQYTISRIEDDSNCAGKAYGGAEVREMPRPEIVISGPGQICTMQAAKLTASGGQDYEWSTGETGDQITVAPRVTTVYYVNAFTPAGCSGTAAHTIEVLEVCETDATDK